MPTEECIIAVYGHVDEIMGAVPKHPRAKRYPSEAVTLALLYALKGAGGRALYRLFAARRAWADRFLAEPTALGSVDSYGVEPRHARRHGRVATRQGRTGPANRRVAGGKLRVVVNRWGRVVAGDSATANVRDATFRPLVERSAERSILLADGNFHCKAGDPANLKGCPRGTWPPRVLVEAALSLLPPRARRPPALGGLPGAPRLRGRRLQPARRPGGLARRRTRPHPPRPRRVQPMNEHQWLSMLPGSGTPTWIFMAIRIAEQ